MDRKHRRGVVALSPSAWAGGQQTHCCCSHINSHNQVRGHRTSSSHSGAEEYPREKHTHNPRWYTHISQLTQFMPPPETYKKSEIGSSLRCAGSMSGAYVSLLAPGKTAYTACHPRKTNTYITRSINHYAYARQTQVKWKKKQRTNNKKRKERRKKRRKRKKKTKKEKKEKEKTRKKQEKASLRQEEEARKGKREKKCHTSRP